MSDGQVVDPADRPAPAHRIGTRADVLARSLSALASRLPALTVRGPDDPAVALLDAWATVADIVTFYQARIADEGFLRTATERRSVLELARAIGYELGPGVAATAYLAFTVEDAPGAPPEAVVPAGTRVQSVPGQGELPQTFETSQELVAAVGRNSMPLRLRRPQRIGADATGVRLAGVTTGLRPGDALLIRSGAEGGPWRFRILRTIEPLPTDATGRPATTLVRWDPALDLSDQTSQGIEVYAFRLRAAIFGHNAPDWRSMHATVQESYLRTARQDGTARFDRAPFDAVTFDSASSQEWPGFGLPDSGWADGPVIDLDAAYPAIAPGSWLVLRAPGIDERLYQVAQADLAAAADFGLTAATTRLRLRGGGDLSLFPRRATSVYAQAERLRIAEEPITEPVTGPELVLDRPTTAEPGTLVMVTGRTVDGLTFTQPAHIGPDRTRVSLGASLGQPLDPASVRVLGNVVTATAGQTTEEVLGSGDGGAALQSFTLLHADLTHTPAPTSGGVRDSLEVRVDGITWAEAASLFSLGPHDRSYVVRIDDHGRASVIFGDGERGARLPSGQENVRAGYRTGLGSGGNVRAGALSLLLTQPLGITGVDNPLPASGGSAPERLENARAAAPLTVRTLDRVVSLTDHEAFARAFAGIAKARAVVLRAGAAPVIHVTVAPDGGGEVSETTLAALAGAFDEVGRPDGRPDLGGYRPVTFAVAIAVLVAADRQQGAVFRAVTDAVRAAYSFDRREFAQPVTAAEVVTVAHRVPGVVAVNLTTLHLSGGGPFDMARFDTARFGETLVADMLPARGARLAILRGPGGARPVVMPAELLLVDPAQITVTEMAP